MEIFITVIVMFGIIGLLGYGIYKVSRAGEPTIETTETRKLGENEMPMETEAGYEENAPGSIADDVRTIKNCVVFFTVVNIIGFISAIFFIGNIMSKIY